MKQFENQNLKSCQSVKCLDYSLFAAHILMHTNYYSLFTRHPIHVFCLSSCCFRFGSLKLVLELTFTRNLYVYASLKFIIKMTK